MTTERESDQELVGRAQAGDRGAFDVLVMKYRRRLMRLLKRAVRDPSETEDVVQEAFIKAYRALPYFRGDAAFYTWLYRIAINTARNHVASVAYRVMATAAQSREQAHALEEQLRDNNTPESVLASKQIALTVSAAVDALPHELRITIILRELEGLSYEDIALATDCPLGTVRSRIFRARELIAERLAPLIDKAEQGRW
ncbi:RNA polymerase sigma factor RpoE [Pseudoduganella ginsengisoli]|uniref:RNA polymerase sigma factor n=1 Tax=Pseudoduganella ginsengisoli TaxID=1462440 RepID=A0A6L6PY86_9BURK|nr:RNA polymerase sigma factor RpoE [Pseudoduganella ginsengisoli]